MGKPQRFAGSRRSLLLGVGATLVFSAVMRPWHALAQASGSSKFPIGVIGSGHIGGAIGGLWVMYGRRPRCKRNLTISEAFGCSHVSGL